MLEIIGLTRRFGPRVAVDAISFAVNAGEVVGLVGPNGAGKSTTMKMIAGFLAPTAGTAVVCGHDIVRRPLRAKRQIGYLPEGAPAYPDMTVAGFLRFGARIRGMRGVRARRRIAETAELLAVGELLHQKIGALPVGRRRQVAVAQALLHDPPLLILDEPTDGLDPNQQHAMRGVIRTVREGKAVIVATRLLEEVEAVCSRAVVMAHGRILADATPTGLAARSRYHNAVRLAVPAGADPAIAAELARLPGVLAVEPANDGEGEGWWIFPWRARPIVAEVAELARARGLAVTGLRVERGRLDDVFRAITQSTPPPRPPQDAA